MKIKSVKIENYKSFGTENNIIGLEDISTIIGKNESGKSNLINCLSRINLTGMKDTIFFNEFNKNNNQYPNISLVLIPYDFEEKNFNSTGETKITLNDQTDFEIEGALTELISTNKTFLKNRENMNELNVRILNRFSDQAQRTNFSKVISAINNAENKQFINHGYIKNIIDRLESIDECQEFLKHFRNCIGFLNELTKLYPTFVSLDDLTLKSKYTTTALKDAKEDKRMINYFLEAINSSMEELLSYWTLNKQADKENFSEEFNEKISSVIEEFNRYYTQEQVTMKVCFENDSVNFIIKTTKKYMDFNERSNGLKWYLNIYFQLIAKIGNNDLKNNVILIDEPGVYLHVNAQKELLNLFENLKNRGNQIIYTTHSPFMIYQDKLYRSKSIIKDENGNSNIGNKFYTLPHKMGSKSDTITPILTTMGMNLNYNIFGIDNAKTNIIVEGMSDYYYLRAYFYQKDKDSIPNIMPSTSVDNIHNIVTILTGWGFEYKIIIDQDHQGRGQYEVLINSSLVDVKNLIFVNGTNVPNKDKNCDMTIEDVFSNEDKKKIGMTKKDYNNEKIYYSLATLKNVEDELFKYDKETMKNFSEMIDKLY